MSSESELQKQQSQFDIYLEAVKRELGRAMHPEAERIPDNIDVLAAFWEGTGLHAVSMRFPGVSKEMGGIVNDWIVTLTYDASGNLVGFNSVFSKIPERQPEMPVTVKGTIASLRGGEGIGSFTAMAHKQALQHYTNRLGRTIVNVMQDENAQKFAGTEVRDRWESVFADDGTAGFVGGKRTFTPNGSSDTESHFYQVTVTRAQMPQRKPASYQFIERQPSPKEIALFATSGFGLSSTRTTVDLPKLATTIQRKTS